MTTEENKRNIAVTTLKRFSRPAMGGFYHTKTVQLNSYAALDVGGFFAQTRRKTAQLNPCAALDVGGFRTAKPHN